jgi:ABC-type transport system substrate-binding protein/DNA-binding SARP family transcriptional activator
VSEPLEFWILGPLEARRGGRALELPAGKSRALLVVLLLHRNEVVSVDRLVDELWGERPPPTAAKNVQVYVSRLRRALGEGALLTRAPGYVLQIKAEQLDAERFRALLEEARRQEPTQASERLRQALALWRGPPLADFGYESFAQEEIRRLEELRLSALEERIEADLALGRHEDVLSELESLVAANPLRERLQGQLMLTLYRCGRQAEALEAYRAGRRRLVEELGLEPRPDLQGLERAILAHDPSLAAPARVPPPDGGAAERARSLLGRRSRLLLAAGVIVLAAAALGTGLRLSRGSATLEALPNSIGVIDAGHISLSHVIEAGGQPGGIAYGEGGAWVTDTSGDVVFRIDPAGEKIDRVPVGHGPTGVAVGGGQVWVVNELDRTVSEVNPEALREVNTVPVGLGARAIASGAGSVWVGNGVDSTITRIDPNSGQVMTTIPLPGAPTGIAVSRAGVWVTSASTGLLLLIDPDSNRVAQAKPIGNGPTGVAVGAGRVWVTNSPDATVSRFDPGSGNVRKVPVGDSPAGVAYGNGAVWVANGTDGTVSRIDPKTNSTREIAVGNEPTALTVAGREVWATVLPSPASHRGGTMRVLRSRGQDSADPAAWRGTFTHWQMLSLTNDGLVAYRRIGGLAGDTLVPDLATTLAAPTGSGRTYTFQLRRGIRYSNGALVRPADLRRAIERVFKLQPPYVWRYYTGIVGADRCLTTPERIGEFDPLQRPPHCDLSEGIVADEGARTVTFHLTKPDPEFLYKLAFPMAYAVPPGTPDHDIGRRPLPATGPYMTSSFSPSGSWILVRNPRFHEWSRDAQPDGYPSRIVLRQYRNLRAGIRAVEHGATDVLLFTPGSDRLAGLGTLGRLATRYAHQLHSDPFASTFAFVMNTQVPPFDRLAVRRALNYAIDRDQIVRYAGGTLAAQKTCQILPPTLPGYRPYCPYTVDPSSGGSWTGSDLAKARELVRRSGTGGMKITVWHDQGYPAGKIGPYLLRLLRKLGYEASLKTQRNPPYPAQLADSRNRTQVGWFGWFQDYPAPSNFIAPLLSCDAFAPRSAANFNLAEFCNDGIDARIRRARSLETGEPAAAGELWGRIDRELVDQAPWVPLYNERALTALSTRVGNYRYHPFWTVLLDQLWVR